MNPRRLRLEQALAALPDIEEMKALREALLDESQSAEEQVRPSSGYLPLDRRPAELDRLEERIPDLVERVRERLLATLGHTTGALRALERGDPADAAGELIAAGEVEESAWRLEAAAAFYAKAVELGRKPRKRHLEGLALRRLARIARTRGDLAEALQLYRDSYEVYEAERDDEGMVIGCLGVGNVLVDRGDWEMAREWYSRGIERLGERATAEYLHLCNALSVVERRLGRYDESDAWLRRGEAVAAAVGDAAAKAYLEHGRARLHMARGEVDEAVQRLRTVLAQELDPIARISTLINLAEPLLLQERLPEAEGVLRQAEELALRYGAIRHLPHVYELLGRLLTVRRDPDGFVLFEQALDIVREHRLPPIQEAAVQHAYGSFEAATGQLEAAAARLRIARERYLAIGALFDAAAIGEELRALEARPADSPLDTPPSNEEEGKV